MITSVHVRASPADARLHLAAYLRQLPPRGSLTETMRHMLGIKPGGIAVTSYDKGRRLRVRFPAMLADVTVDYQVARVGIQGTRVDADVPIPTANSDERVVAQSLFDTLTADGAEWAAGFAKFIDRQKQVGGWEAGDL